MNCAYAHFLLLGTGFFIHYSHETMDWRPAAPGLVGQVMDVVVISRILDLRYITFFFLFSRS